jgi:F-type H+-transporting ATPase subunit b
MVNAKKREIINDARQKAIEILASADEELEKYKEERKQEIEKNLVKLVMSVTEKVVERSLDYNTHIDLIQDAVNEVKQQKELL